MRRKNNASPLWILAAASLACSSSATGTASHRDAYALATCTDTITCCLQRNPGAPDQCGLTASEAAAHMATLEAATRRARDKANEREEEDHDDGWKELCRETYVLCRDAKKPRWQGDCYACFRNCEGQRQWPYEMCSQGKR
ncbi:hypothetical protein [Myxococcus hansupus]|uniref:hypothetical protein n=1 Tax=Pseudomyxococcus hansupus TaxID=1297742 RepID=UPI0009E63492|nr:hypothetical protein [Myxococcus hansupus]